MTAKIDRIKAALKQHIAEAEESTPGRWKKAVFWVQSQNGKGITDFASGELETAECISNAQFCAQARTMSPAACRALLVAIEAHQLVMSYRQQGSFDTSKQALADIEAAFPEIA